MTKLPLPSAAVLFLLSIFIAAAGLGSGATLAVTSSGAVCGLTSSPFQNILCHRRGSGSGAAPLSIFPNVSFPAVSGGLASLCALRGGALLCWDDVASENSTLAARAHRVFYNNTLSLQSLAVGDSHACVLAADSGSVKCMRVGSTFSLPSPSESFSSLSSGSGYSCGLTVQTSRVRCWGSGSLPPRIESGFGNASMLSLVSGGSHSCGLNSTGFIVCHGANSSGQLGAPTGSEPLEFSQLSLGANHSCAIRASNGSAVCWGGDGRFSGSVVPSGVSFELIASGSGFSCGLTTVNFSVLCWGPGWSNNGGDTNIPLPEILPGPCVQSSCGNCSTYPLSQRLCSGRGTICKPCFDQTLAPPPPPPSPEDEQSPPAVPPPRQHSQGLRRGLLAFAIVGSVGGFAGLCTAAYCLYTGVCFGKKKIHNSVQPTITRSASSNNGNGNGNGTSPPSRCSTIRRQGSRIMRRTRSGTSSSKHADRAEEFSLAELAAATGNFSPENKLGGGSFGVVYRGKLSDGREVAIKRGETGQLAKKYQEKESAFESELAFLSRLHHKHLVRLVGFCEEKEERLLVYEFMKNGALYDHLHDKNNVEKQSNVVNSWKLRIKIALDAARGIEYLHNYAVPQIIHRDIKSSNILLDGNWTAKVSDFGLSLMGPESGRDIRPEKAAGTVGYIDPEYYGLNVLTSKSDVYGLGVVLLELLTGKRAIFRTEGGGAEGGSAMSVVDFAVPAIMAGELGKVLDRRVGVPELNEGEAVELVGYTAMHCVNLEGKERPTMTDIVANLERALSLCDDSHGSISSGIMSIVSE